MEEKLLISKDKDTEDIFRKDRDTIKRFIIIGSIAQSFAMVLHIILACFLAKEQSPTTAAFAGSISIILLFAGVNVFIFFIRDYHLVKDSKRRVNFLQGYGGTVFMSLLLKVFSLVAGLVQVLRCENTCPQWSDFSLSVEMCALAIDGIVLVIITHTYIRMFIKIIANRLIEYVKQEEEEYNARSNNDE